MKYSLKKKVLVVGLNYDQIPFINIIKKIGLFVIGVDINNKAPGIKYCDMFYNTSYENYEKIYLYLKKNKFSSNDYLFTASSQNSLMSLCKIAKKFNIKFLDFNILDKCIDKTKMCKLLKKNKILIPNTRYLVNNKIKIDKKKTYFLKSDYGKSPKYCYIIKNGKIPKFPTKDSFFRKYFLLQEKVNGTHYRINLLRDKMFIFKKKTDRICKPDYKFSSFDKSIRVKLRSFSKKYKLNNFLLKFDIIIDNMGWYLIDIGFDPPKRLEAIMQYKNKNFYKAYVYNWLKNKNLFNKFNLKNCENLIIKIRKNGQTEILEK